MDYNSHQDLLAVGYFGEIIEIYKFNESKPSENYFPPFLELIKTLDLGMVHSQIVKFISPKELFVSTYGSGFNVYHCDFNRKCKINRVKGEDTDMVDAT